ncbi:uncharacterized protein FFC1_03867 [Fusarium fujikuroi]|nr:uncharacterized protein FFC1_03867 [Fusarium fujikuroi]
MGIKVNTLSYT